MIGGYVLLSVPKSGLMISSKDYLSVSFSEVAQQSSLDDSLLTFAQAMPVFASLL